MTVANDVKETAVRQSRLWVRLTRACNNRCMFCLDSDSQDGTFVPASEVEQQLRHGREQGLERLILSGGEPTIHPDFLRFVRLGRDLGFPWVQVISNGRMFAYNGFANEAIAGGLNEATLSLHAHNAELYEKLIGVKGTWPQAMRGLRNLLGRIVVSVDIVLSRLTLPHLADILDFYVGLGVTEFDLLHMVPFGRAWNEFRKELFYDPEEMLPHLRNAFSIRGRHPNVVLWTNRLPAAFLEGEEDLIQDPHKLHDEVRGRKEMFEQWRDAGIPPVCLGDRCPHCPMDLFCHSLASVLAGRAGGLPPASPDVLPLARGIAARLAGMPDTERRKTRLRAVPHEYLSEARAHDPDLSEVREIARLGVPILGLPPCLGGPAQPPPAVPRPGPEALAADGRLDLVRFTDWFVRHACRVKSLRCRKCAHREQCPGLHINQARSWGFAAMQPLEE